MDGGWIQLHRKIVDSPVAHDPFLLKLWILCLVRANYTRRDVLIGRQSITVERGQFVTGRDSLAREYNERMKASMQVKPITLWRWMQSLESMGNLIINSNNKFSLVTVVNYDFYNTYVEPNDQQNEQLVISKRSSDDQQMITDNKVTKEQGNKDISEDQKIAYAEFVTLTSTEYVKLVEKLGEDVTRQYIDKLDNYKGSKGKRYKSDYRTLLTWVTNDNERTSAGGGKNHANNGRAVGDEDWERIERGFFTQHS